MNRTFVVARRLVWLLLVGLSLSHCLSSTETSPSDLPKEKDRESKADPGSAVVGPSGERGGSIDPVLQESFAEAPMPSEDRRQKGMGAEPRLPPPLPDGAAAGYLANSVMPQADPPSANRDGWYQNTYLAGAGSRESLQKAVNEGVLVNGQRIKLEAFTAQYHQSYPFPSSSALGMSLSSERSRILPEGGSVFLEVGLQASAQEAGDRPPLNVVLVLDRSGSMQSEGKWQAVVAAAQAVVDRLTPKDRLALVTYSSVAQVPIPMSVVKDSASLKATIAALGPEGGTNIYAGLEAAYAEARKSARAEAASLVLLLSDGQVTAGERSPDRFEGLVKMASDEHISTSSVGMGVSYDEALMMRVATAGAGNYHFLKDAGDTESTIATELDELAKAIARGVRLRIVLPPNVNLVRVLGSEELNEQQVSSVRAEERRIDRQVYEELGIQQDRKDQDEKGIKMLIPSFKANDAHVVLLELWVGPGRAPIELATVELKYKDMLTKRNQTVNATLKVDYAPDRTTSVASISRAVKKNILGFKTGEALMAASKDMARGDYPAAIRKIDDQLVLMGTASREWKDTDLERDALLLGKYKEVLTQHARQGSSPELIAYLGKSFSYSAYQRLK